MYRESHVIAMQTTLNIDDLIQNYVEEYYKQEHPFLLFKLAHVHENDHTRVLLSILKYNNHLFLKSFLQMIGAPECDSIQEELTDQKQAIGMTGKGYIDLYFEYKTKDNKIEKVIIENKISGAGDTYYQLARYIATALEISNDKFITDYWNEWKKGNSANITEEKFKHLHVVYLTSDGGKKPKKISLPEFFRKDSSDDDLEVQHINYYPINYIDHIIPWLENDVLPIVPYADDGMMIAGIRQYIASLKKDYCRNTESKVLTNWIKERRRDASDNIYTLYQNLDKVLTELKKQQNTKDDPKQIALTQLSKDLYNYQKHLFNEEAPKGWSLYFTPSFILMFKDSWWSDSDKKANYNFPSIHLNCSPTSNFFKDTGKLTWRLKIERLPIQGTEYNLNSDDWKPIRNSIVKELNDGKRTSVDFKNKNDRTKYFEKIIGNNTIIEINKFIENCSDNSFQDALLKHYQKAYSNPLNLH